MARGILKRLRYDNDTIDKVTELVYWHDCEILPEIRAVRRAASKVGTALFPLLLEVKRADLAAQSDYQKAETVSYTHLEVFLPLLTAAVTFSHGLRSKCAGRPVL